MSSEEGEQSEQDQPTKRPMTVTFNVPDFHSTTSSLPNQTLDTRNSKTRPTTTMKSQTAVKTADLSHTTDRRAQAITPTFIPKEFVREIQTPTPLRPGTGVLNVDKKTWHTQVFPSENPTSLEEVENLGDWLNQMLEQNQKSTEDPLQLAANARHWYSIAYDELCREISIDCPERAQLLSSIWKRYQSLFQRVVQLHEEERDYLVKCHKERTTKLKGELDSSQAKLKQISQQYRDDQERWSNAREREETKFANMRKKLDLQVKNKRNLLMQINAFKEKLEENRGEEEKAEKEEVAVAKPIPAEPGEELDEVIKSDDVENSSQITPQQISDRVHQLRHRIRTEKGYFMDVTAVLDDIAHLVDQDRAPSKATRELFPLIFKGLATNHAGHTRTLEWTMSAITYIYSLRLNELSARRQPFPCARNRQHFACSIYQQFLTVYGSPQQAAETFFDLVDTAKGLAAAGNLRCVQFLRFIDAEAPYFDSIFLDFYLFCAGSFVVSNTAAQTIFPDVFEEDTTKFSPITGSMACDVARKILFSVSESDIAGKYVQEMKEKLQITDDATVCVDDVFEYCLNAYQQEEKRASESLREQYDMDAAQYGGIVSYSQFQTLSCFSSRKLDFRMYGELMREAMMTTNSQSMSFSLLTQTLHKYAMLVPFNFERIDYNPDAHLDDTVGFMRNEFHYHMPEITNLLEKTRKADESLFKQLNAAKAKFEQVVETKRTGFFTEVAQRELYELIQSIDIE